MNAIERDTLKKIVKSLRERLSDKIKGVYAFGSRVRGDYHEGSDFDVLIVVKDRNPLIENEIISVFVEEELQRGLVFTPLIKDAKAFESEKSFNTPFYENIMKEGIDLLI